MKRWLTPCLLGLLLSGTGCALNECKRCNVCAHFWRPAEPNREAVQPPSVPGPAVAPPQQKPAPAPLQMPPPLIQKANENTSAIPRRMPTGDAPEVLAQTVSTPLIVQTQSDVASVKPSAQAPPIVNEAQKPTTAPPIMDARSVPKFRQPTVGWAEAAPLPMPNGAVPIAPDLKKTSIPALPIEIINQVPTGEPSESRDAGIPKMETRAPRPESANDVRYSHYMEVEQTPSPPFEEEVRHATFGPATPAVLELEPLPRTITFGMPKPIQPAVRRERQVDPMDIPSIPLLVPTPCAEPTIMAAMKARLRRPHFLDAPIAKKVMKKHATALAFAPVENDLEIVQYQPEDWPSALAPFIVIQEAAKGMLPANTAALLEAERQIIDYRQADEAARPLAELGPPVVPEPQCTPHAPH